MSFKRGSTVLQSSLLYCIAYLCDTLHAYIQLYDDSVQSFRNATGIVLTHNRRVVVYSGKLDFACNYMGGLEWANGTKWSGQVRWCGMGGDGRVRWGEVEE